MIDDLIANLEIAACENEAGKEAMESPKKG